MTRAQLSNNASTSLSAAIVSASATTFSVVAASKFPQVTTANGQYFYCTLLDVANIPEIVKVTDITGTTFTVVRGQDGTAGRTFLIGATVSHRVVAANFAELADVDYVQAEKETLPALAQALHVGAIVRGIVYDTAKDRDGGAWRKRCADKSWYTEALGGDRWIGRYGTVAAAWAAAGGATGAVFQASATAAPLTAGKYYAATSATTATEVFRGISREFPAVAGIVAESLRLVIYDLTAPGCPMWMVTVPTLAVTAGWEFWRGSRTISSVCAKDGSVYFSLNYPSLGGVAGLRFLSDQLVRHGVLASGGVAAQSIGLRNTAPTAPYVSVLPSVINDTVNDVAITVLDTAPIDPATGLPVPTLAAATLGGVSVIKDDGTVVNSSSVGNFQGVFFVGAALHYWLVTSPQWAIKSVVGLGSAWSSDQVYINGSVPALLALSNSSTYRLLTLANDAAGNTLGVTKLKRNPASAAAGMMAYITNAYNSGWMAGDIRGAFLADTVAETITAATPLIDDFSGYADTAAMTAAGWTATTGTVTLAAGKLRVEALGGVAAYGWRSFPTVVGRAYKLIATHTKTAINSNLGVGTSGVSAANGSLAISASGTYELSFVATVATTFVTFYTSASATVGQYIEWDDIFVKLAEPDRSVKNNALTVVGSLTKTAVAAAAALVAYSAFSAANYLEQPYNADLNFGAGEFSAMSWVNLNSLVAQQYIFSLGSAGAPTLSLYVSNTGVFAYVCHATGTAVATTVAAVIGLQLVELSRTGGFLNLRVNGVQVYSIANTVNLTNPLAKLTVGVSNAYAGPMLGSIALLRICSTAPSADQSAHIYRTEQPLFQAGAQCTLAGTSTAVTALAYDETTDLLHAGTSWGRSSFKDLLRVDSDATTTGALTSLSAYQGVILTGGTSAKVYVPAMTLREELRRKDEARKALGKTPVFFDFTATASQTAFVLPAGYTAKALYKQGALMREATTGVYWSRSTDGFRETCTLSVGATVSDWISIMAVRE